MRRYLHCNNMLYGVVKRTINKQGPPRCHRSTINATQPGRQLASIPFVALLPKPTFVGKSVLQLYSSWTSGPHVACSSLTWGSEHYYQPLVVHPRGACRQLPTTTSTTFTTCTTEEATTRTKGTDNARAGAILFGPRRDSWWTGCRPEVAPGMRPDGTISSLPQLFLGDCDKKALQDYLDNTWVLTEILFAGLQGEEAFMVSPGHGLRHPLIFYYGHAAALYVNKLRAAGIIRKPVNAYLEALLETGLDEMAWDHVGGEDMKWPAVEEVNAYRREVYELVSKVIASAPEEMIKKIGVDNPYWALAMAFEHERIHLETSSVLIRELPLGYVTRPATWPDHYPCDDGTSSPIENPLIRVEAGSVTLGKPKEFPSFGWDNEYGSRTLSVPAFEASKYMISNGEFLEFVKDVGYARRELWTESGWGWKSFRNVKWPKFWIPQGPSGLHEYHLRTVFDEVPMPLNWPVIVNFHEAQAFATWKTMREDQINDNGGKTYRLTTELEHHMMRGSSDLSSLTSTSNPEIVDPVLSTRDPPIFEGSANVNLVLGSETPVDKHPPNDRGFHDLVGNAWEWCEDHFSALDGFSIDPLYEDFSTPCFDGKHHVIMGGSFTSTGNEASIFARFHFRPHFHQHAGFRLVAPLEREEAESFITSCTDAPSPFVGTYPYRTSGKGATAAGRALARRLTEEQGVAANMAMHYSVPPLANDDQFIAKGLRYPQRCARIVLRTLEGTRSPEELVVVEVGCGAGGGSFELSKGVGTVIALDASKPLLDVASTMAKCGMLTVECPLSRGSSMTQEAALDTGVESTRITFRQCDPMCLPAGLADLDAVLIHSVIDAVPSPNTLLARMGGPRGLVKKNGGIVVVVSPYDWNEEITPRQAWLCGCMDYEGKKVSPAQGLSKALGEDFKLIHVEQVPRIRPLADRMFEYASAEATVWRRD